MNEDYSDNGENVNVNKPDGHVKSYVVVSIHIPFRPFKVSFTLDII